MPRRKSVKSISKKSIRLIKHKCIWKQSDHQFRSSSRCRICGKQKTKKLRTDLVLWV
jgi:hypothetical protein